VKHPNPPDTLERIASEQALVQKLVSKEADVKMEGKISIDTLIIAGSMLVSGALAYATLDKRVSLLEQQANSTVQLTTERANENRDALRAMQSDIKELTEIIQDKKEKETRK
jgi:hypothetical protein